MNTRSSSIDWSRARALPAAPWAFALAGAGLAWIALVFRSELPPFALAAGYAFALLVFLSAKLGRGRAMLHNAAFALLAFALAELILFYVVDRSPRVLREGSYVQRHFTSLPELGYGSIAERRVVSSRLLASGTIVYDVTYTMDEHGLRVTPQGYSRRQAFFFGCSYTFGEGVQDDETLPARFGAAADLSPVNFGFHGYGPHQMLRALEIDLPRAFGHGAPSVAVYTAHPAHFDRANGRSPWDQHGPKFELVGDTLRYVGPFSSLPRVVDSVLARSTVVSTVRNRFAALAHDEVRDRELFLAIVRESSRLLQAKYGVQLYVLLWDVGPQLSPVDRERAGWLRRAAPGAGLQLVALSEAAPQLEETRFYLPVDTHPTPAAYALAAKALAEYIAQRHEADAPARSVD